jgi:hypothetical protein
MYSEESILSKRGSRSKRGKLDERTGKGKGEARHEQEHHSLEEERVEGSAQVRGRKQKQTYLLRVPLLTEVGLVRGKESMGDGSCELTWRASPHVHVD